MRLLQILLPAEIKEFEQPPIFDTKMRKHYFEVTGGFKRLLNQLETPANKIGFCLQWGYFKASGRFYTTLKFHKKDIAYVTKALTGNSQPVSLINYSGTTVTRHRQLMMDYLGFEGFNEINKQKCLEEALQLALKQTSPKKLFKSLLEFLKTHQIEIPAYYTLSEMITRAFKHAFEKTYLIIENHTTPTIKSLLDNLFTKAESEGFKDNITRLSRLKNIEETVKPSTIKENIKHLKGLKNLYETIIPILSELDLSDEITQYYAGITDRMRAIQLSQKQHEPHKYLLLICFLKHQYFKMGDLLIDTYLQSVKTVFNSAQREYKESIYQQHKNQGNNKKYLKKMLEIIQKPIDMLWEIDETITAFWLTDDQKLKKVNELVNYAALKSLSQNIQDVSRHLQNESMMSFLDVLENKSLKLQNRVAEIIRFIEISSETQHTSLDKAIEAYKKGSFSVNPPLAFLEEPEQKAVFDQAGKFKISLYKALLADYIAKAIKSGELNIPFSYKYRPFEDYLIPLSQWHIQREEMLYRANLQVFYDWQGLKTNLEKAIEVQYTETNENIINGENLYVKMQDNGKLRFLNPKKDDENEQELEELYPSHRLIPVFEVLSTVQKATKFLQSFKHWQQKVVKEKPDEKIFIAGIIGYGCNLGINQMARCSKNITAYSLETAVNWYFTVENLEQANHKILKIIKKLSLSKLLRKKATEVHTSSDGQKFNIAVDSVHANYSYKYFGKGKGVTVYSFMDDAYKLFHSTVISSSEREAGYVIDGLMHNEVVQSDLHSTDTHGFSETIFALTYLLGITFAPRINDFREQRLYSMNNIQPNREYFIQLQGKIDHRLIEENWDNILRLVTTIKLKYTTASSILRRLNSYSKQNPVYRALKELGKAVKTLFLLKYMDDQTLRKRIDNQTNKLESIHKMARAIFYGNSGEFQHASKEQQLLSEGCKRLIENAIICWNYLYLTKKLTEITSFEEREAFIHRITHASMGKWKHITTWCPSP